VKNDKKGNKMKFLTSLVLLFLVSNSILNANVPADEREALVTLYNNNYGSNWTNQRAWNDGDPCVKNWHGVGCNDAETHVVGINLEDNKLDNEIPDELCNLTELEFIDLSHNNLEGNIPICMQNLTHLIAIDLKVNNLSGEMPTWMYDTPSFYGLDLSQNNFSGTIPKDIDDAADLSYFNISNNLLTGEIPAELMNIDTSILTKFDISNNQYIYTDDTNVQTFINDINSSLPNYYQDILNTNKANDEYAFLVRLYDSTDGDNWSDNTNWNVGDHCSQSARWEGVYCENNRISHLYLNNNNLNGTIPSQIGSLTQVQRVKLNNNNLSGKIPSEIGSLTNMDWLYLEHNMLTGDIPSTIGNLHNLTNLALYNNKLTGDIPSQITNLSALQYIYANNNYFLYSDDREVIDFIDDVAGNGHEYDDIFYSNSATTQEEGLIRLYYSTDGNNWTNNTNWNVGSPCNNNWFGVYCYYGDGTVNGLNLSNNNLDGEIPTQIANLQDLENLTLSHNHLNENIPSQIISIPNLVEISLNNNEFTGHIPSGLGNLVHLNALDLSYNKLTGDIPTDIGNLSTNLEYISLRNNNLTGNIPSEFGSITALKNLTLGYNQLSGNIPIEITNLGNLINIWLENNCNLSSKESEEDSIRTFINSVQNHSQAYQYILNTNTHDNCSDNNSDKNNLVPVIMYLLN